MMWGPAVLSILGLAPYFQEAETIVTVTKDGYEAIKAAKAMLDSPEGEKFKTAIKDAISAAQHGMVEKAQTTISKADEVLHPTVQYAAGSYEWDSLQGWVWVPSED